MGTGGGGSIYIYIHRYMMWTNRSCKMHTACQGHARQQDVENFKKRLHFIHVQLDQQGPKLSQAGLGWLGLATRSCTRLPKAGDDECVGQAREQQRVKMLWLLRCGCTFFARRLRELAEGRPKEHRVFYLACSSVTTPRTTQNPQSLSRLCRPSFLHKPSSTCESVRS